AAGRTAELGAVAAGLHLLFGDGLERHLHEVEVGEGIGDVEAVQVVVVLGDGRAAERGQVAERGVAADGTRGQQGHRGAVARNRDLVDLLGGQDRGRFDRGHVDRVDDVGAAHGDGPEGGGAGAAGEVDVGGNAHVDADLTRGAAVLADLVGAGRQGREAVVAVGTDGDRAAEAGGRVADGDDVARIGTTGNRTGSVGLG